MATTTTNLDEAINFIEAYAGTKHAPVITEADIKGILEQAQVVDAKGTPPTAPGYKTTWNLEYAVSLAFERKAAAALSTTGELTSFTSEGTSITRAGQATSTDFYNQANRWKAKATNATGINIIQLDSTVTPAKPRSAYWGETPDEPVINNVD